MFTRFNVKAVLFQTIHFRITIVSMSKTVSFQTIQFRISTQFSSIWSIDRRTLSGAATRGQSGPRSDDNEGVLRISQSSRITGTSLSDCLESYPGHSLGWGRRSRSILQPQPTGQSCRVILCLEVWDSR